MVSLPSLFCLIIVKLSKNNGTIVYAIKGIAPDAILIIAEKTFVLFLLRLYQVDMFHLFLAFAIF